MSGCLYISGKKCCTSVYTRLLPVELPENRREEVDGQEGESFVVTRFHGSIPLASLGRSHFGFDRHRTKTASMLQPTIRNTILRITCQITVLLFSHCPRVYKYKDAECAVKGLEGADRLLLPVAALGINGRSKMSKLGLVNAQPLFPYPAKVLAMLFRCIVSFTESS